MIGFKSIEKKLDFSEWFRQSFAVVDISFLPDACAHMQSLSGPYFPVNSCTAFFNPKLNISKDRDLFIKLTLCAPPLLLLPRHKSLLVYPCITFATVVISASYIILCSRPWNRMLAFTVTNSHGWGKSLSMYIKQ